MTKFRCTLMNFVAYLRIKYLLFFLLGPNSEEEMLRGEPRIVQFKHIIIYG
jgi:hypothetical protein